MVVRINKLDISESAAKAGWPQNELSGNIAYQWPADANLYEVMILEQDETKKPLKSTFRQQQLRKLIPSAIEAVREMSDQLVVRLDGQVVKGELAVGYSRIVTGDELFRFGASAVRRMAPQEGRAYGSIRACVSARQLISICADESLGLERSVRLRIFAVPDGLIGAVLDIDAVSDERWGEILRQAGFVLGTTARLGSLQLFTRRLDAGAIKSRLTQRLMRPASRPINA